MTKILFLGESHKDGNDSGDSSGDDSDFGDMEDGEEGDEGKRRKNASQQRYKYFISQTAHLESRS
jgi:nucleosome binding factor SPN SPT16 subunit